MAIRSEGKHKSPRGVLFWERSIERPYRFIFNTKATVEVIDAPPILVRDPFMRLKQKKLGQSQN